MTHPTNEKNMRTDERTHARTHARTHFPAPGGDSQVWLPTSPRFRASERAVGSPSMLSAGAAGAPRRAARRSCPGRQSSRNYVQDIMQNPPVSHTFDGMGRRTNERTRLKQGPPPHPTRTPTPILCPWHCHTIRCTWAHVVNSR